MATVTDKIRIVGSFGEDTIDKVRQLVDGLDGVQSVSVLRDGVETYPDADSIKAETGETGDTSETATPATPETAEPTA